MEVFILVGATLVGFLILSLLIFELARIIFRPRIKALLLKHRVSIIQRNRIRARGFLYSNNKKKDCWL